MNKKNIIGIVILLIGICFQIYNLAVKSANWNIFDIKKNIQYSTIDNYKLNMFLDITKEYINENKTITIFTYPNEQYSPDFNLEKYYIRYYLYPIHVSDIFINYEEEINNNKVNSDYILKIGKYGTYKSSKLDDFFKLYRISNNHVETIISSDNTLYALYKTMNKSSKLKNFKYYLNEIIRQYKNYHSNEYIVSLKKFKSDLKENNDIEMYEYLINKIEGDIK